MADTNVISDVSQSIVDLIAGAVADLGLADPVVALEDLSEVGSALPKVTVFLFEVLEDPPSRNRPLEKAFDATKNQVVIRKPPMALQLNYLITPWTKNFVTDQQILGRVLRVCYDEAILGGTQLGGGLASSTDTLKITMHQITLEDRTRIWHALQRPYRTSLSYGVRVVNLDPNTANDQAAVPVNGAQLGSTVGTGASS